MSVKETLFVACERKRRAFALGEALILIIVVLLAFGGIFSSMAYAMRLRSSSQVDLDSYMTAQAWFEALEAEDPTRITTQDELNAVAENVTRRLGGKKLGDGRLGIRVLELTPFYKGTKDGVRLIELMVSKPKAEGGGTLRFLRALNIYSSNTVQDNAYKRRPQ